MDIVFCLLTLVTTSSDLMLKISKIAGSIALLSDDQILSTQHLHKALLCSENDKYKSASLVGSPILHHCAQLRSENTDILLKFY